MTIAAGSAIWNYGAQKTVISDTAQIADAAFNGATITVLAQADHLDAPLADLSLTVTLAVAPAAGSGFNVYRRRLNHDGTNDAPVPDSNYKHTYIGRIAVDLITAIQHLTLDSVPLADGDQEFYIENDTGQTTTTATTTILKVTPKTYNAKA